MFRVLSFGVVGCCAASLALAAGVKVERAPEGAPTVAGDPSYELPEITVKPKVDRSAFGTNLSERIEQLFVAEFEDKEAARAAWRRVRQRCALQGRHTEYPTTCPRRRSIAGIPATPERHMTPQNGGLQRA